MKRVALDSNAVNEFLSWHPGVSDEKAAVSKERSTLVTVVMPVRNGEATIGAAIDSVLNQVHCTVELVVVDDGSTDGTPEILARYGDSIKVIRQHGASVNGLGLTRNRGVNAGSGKWVAFIDADDVWHPRKIISQLVAASEAEASFVFTNTVSTGSLSGRVRTLAYDEDDLRQGHTFTLLLDDNFIFTSSVMVTREAFDGVGGFTGEPDVVQDWDLWLRLSIKGVKFLGVTDPLVNYSWCAGSTSKSHDVMRRRRLGAFRNAMKSGGREVLSLFERLSARSNVESVSAWFLAQDKPARAFLWYARALVFWPFNVKAAKGMLKSSLGMR